MNASLKKKHGHRVAWLTRLCVHTICRKFLRKKLKAAFFESLRNDPQKTLKILTAALISSKNPAWSMQILELMASIPNEYLEANQFITGLFKKSGDDRETVVNSILRAQSVLMSCFSIGSLEVENARVEYSDMISFNPSDVRLLAMNDLLIEREKILEDWFAKHKISAKTVKKNKANFFDLAKQEAETGSCESQYILGLIYLDGFGEVEKDSNKALFWLRASAAQRFAHAQCTLGYLYCLGFCVEKDVNEGKIWLEAAARNGGKLARWAKFQQLN